ncbi:unnamed protein product [Rotaria magnacalcarata]|uniref:Uncharacterized protein n=2 Tax=Rotaria magnacalcarata TaxID=392030 RepID=A0A816RZN0_9BILA|nr:unnamed protein product [Rotaria magnacalcarata]CAF1512507.1 unnamed protein product [Rotaria magnacalcarata]CAF2051287.1 unnamed protein product [Rotaria magnacalcarata]CAF2077702.1 unnamed protein product [Rotaria magnacalcarata]CAF2173514.1 unnamed protein product [Rotaria magnacalcarata]
MKIAEKTEISIVTLVILISCVNDVHGAMSQYKWMYFQPYGSTVNLEPLFNYTECTGQSQCYWSLPNKFTRLVYPLNSSTTSKYSIASNGILTIINIQPSDNGIYHFFKLNNSEWIVSKSLLNLHGAPFESLWLEYWPNVVGGLVAMAAVFISFGLIMFADKYRYRSPKTESTRRMSQRPGTVAPLNKPVIIEQANPVFMHEDDENDINTTQSRRQSTNSNSSGLRVAQF